MILFIASISLISIMLSFKISVCTIPIQHKWIKKQRFVSRQFSVLVATFIATYHSKKYSFRVFVYHAPTYPNHFLQKTSSFEN